MDVSIIIVSWNCVNDLRNCLLSINSETRELEYEVIVFDNASSDGTPDMVEREFPAVRLVRSPRNLGFAQANNRAANLATGEYLLFLNPDTVIVDNALDKMIQFAESGPDAHVFGCRVLNANRKEQPVGYRLPTLKSYFLEYYLRLPSGVQPILSHPTQVDGLFGMFILMKAGTWQQVGGFDEEFFIYSEEVDWFARAKRQGIKALVNPDATIIHLGGRSTSQVSERMYVQLHLSRFRYVKKHFRPVERLLYRVLVKGSVVPEFLTQIVKVLLGRITVRQLLGRLKSCWQVVLGLERLS